MLGLEGLKLNVRRSHSRTTKWNVVFHYSTICYNIFTGVILVPLYLQHFSADLYGYWLATGNVAAWISIVDPGFGMVTQQRVAASYGANAIEKTGKYIGVSIILTLIILALMSILAIVFSITFDNLLKLDLNALDSQQLHFSFVLALIAAILMVFSYTIISANQGLQSSLGIGVVYAIANLGGLSVTYLMLIEGYGIVSLGMASLVRAIIYLVGNSFYLYFRLISENIRIKYDKIYFKEFKSLIAFNFLGRLGGTINNQMSSFVVARYLGATEVAIFKFTQTVPEVAKLVLVRPVLALMPALGHLGGEGQFEKVKRIVVDVSIFLSWGVGVTFGGFILFNGPFISLWVGKEYFGGYTLNLLVVSLVILTIISNSFSYLVFALGNIKMNNIVTFIQAAVYLCILLIGLNVFKELQAVVIAALVAEISISFWYYTKALIYRLRLGQQELRRVSKEFFIVGLINAMLIWLFRSFEFPVASTWVYLVLSVLFYVGAFLISLFVLSLNFRRFTLIHIYRTLKWN
jgi:O-antigen/teichoic acid export membrane protein